MNINPRKTINWKNVIGKTLAYSLLLSTLVTTPNITIHAFKNLSLKLLGTQFIVFLITTLFAGILTAVFPKFMRFRLIKKVGSDFNTPITIQFVVGMMLLVLTLPQMAYVEELIFRQGTGSWPEAILRSILFGLAHFVFGFPVFSVFSATLLGLYLSQLYFEGGISLTAEAHFGYNLILFCIIIVAHVFGSKSEMEADEPESEG